MKGKTMTAKYKEDLIKHNTKVLRELIADLSSPTFDFVLKGVRGELNMAQFALLEDREKDLIILLIQFRSRLVKP